MNQEINEYGAGLKMDGGSMDTVSVKLRTCPNCKHSRLCTDSGWRECLHPEVAEWTASRPRFPHYFGCRFWEAKGKPVINDLKLKDFAWKMWCGSLEHFKSTYYSSALRPDSTDGLAFDKIYKKNRQDALLYINDEVLKNFAWQMFCGGNLFGDKVESSLTVQEFGGAKRKKFEKLYGQMKGMLKHD